MQWDFLVKERIAPERSEVVKPGIHKIIQRQTREAEVVSFLSMSELQKAEHFMVEYPMAELPTAFPLQALW